MDFKDEVTVVIPAKNEAQSIVTVIEAVKAFAKEVIVVDGHSQDDTSPKSSAAGARVICDHERGKGDAIRCVISEIKTKVTVFIDADGSHQCDDIPKLVSPILEGRCEHV